MQANNTKLSIFEPESVTGYTVERRKKAFWVGIGIIAVVAIAAIVWVAWGLNSREREFEDNLASRLELMAASQVQLTEAIFETVVEHAGRVINSDLFRLYAAEVHLIEDSVALLVAGPLPGQKEVPDEVAQLSAQLPMMQNLLIEFTRISGYVGGRVVNRNGTVYVATDAATRPLRAGQMEMVKSVLEKQAPQFGPLRHTDQGLVLDAYLPIFPPEATELDQRPVAVLFLTKIAGDRLKGLSSNALLEKGERIRLLQRVDDGYEEVVPWLPGQLQNVGPQLPLDDDEQLPFGVRLALTGDTTTYSLGLPVAGPDWWVVVEADYNVARETLRSQQKALLSIAGLLILSFSVAFGAIWALFVSNQERKVARHFEILAQEIDKQRQLLDQINNNIADYIVLKDLKGRYQYVNPAFAEAVGRAPEELVGLDNEAVFGYDTARRLEHSDQQVLANESSYTFNETLYLQSQPHHLQISKAPLKDAQGKLSGIVSVIRDVTEIVEVQKRQEQATHKSVEALVRAIELTDPYLAGHSRLMGSLGVEVAKALNAADLEIATIETSANLSQIGKLFVDRDLLFKTEALTAEEKKKMEEHVEHAGKVLKDIDFGLPVYEAVTQMNECVDGSGYPKGLQGDQITFAAKVLAVANSFCAMVEPRAYRGARSIEESLGILEQEGASYDQRVVSALKEVIHSAIGEKLLAKHIARD